MRSKLLALLALVATTSCQLVDDFTCPDEFAGFYPHLISCDKYWSCKDGIAEEKICGNGLGFLDTDDTFTLEQCAELHLVECGERTEIEPPISTQNCPRLFGTFADPEDCGVFWKCSDGKSNRYNCPPGLAYDQESRGCRWADQVAECSGPKITIDEDGGEFECPRDSPAGTFTKHAHPADCRQYFLCIAGVPREYGCPLGTVFNTGSGSGVDGKCSDPEEVSECSKYYEGVELDPRELTRSGFDTGKQEKRDRVRSGSPRKSVPRTNSNRFNPNSIRTGSSIEKDTPTREIVREQSRPAPPALQAIVNNPTRSRPNRPQSRPAPIRQLEPALSRPSPSRQEPPSLPSRLTISSPKPRTVVTEAPQSTQSRTTRPNRLQVLTDRPNIRTTFPRRPAPVTTEEPSTTRQKSSLGSRFSTASRPSFNTPVRNTQAPSTTTTLPPPPPPSKVVPTLDGEDEVDEEGLAAPVKAAPGPNGEEYYYYYYYYDEDEESATTTTTSTTTTRPGAASFRVGGRTSA